MALALAWVPIGYIAATALIGGFEERFNGAVGGDVEHFLINVAYAGPRPAVSILPRTRALNAEGFHVMSWASADAFLTDYDPEKPGCLVADVAMPGTESTAVRVVMILALVTMTTSGTSRSRGTTSR